MTAAPSPREAGAGAAPDAPPPGPASAEAEGESSEALFGRLVHFLGGVREIVRGGPTFPWSDLERLVEGAVASLERSDELFWVANKPAAPPADEYLAVHQARVAILSIRIGLNVGRDRRRLVRLGMAGCLIDVGLWQLPDALLRRLDALSADEQAQYQAHPRLGADLIRRWSPRDPGIVEVVLQHHEREQGQGFPQALPGSAIDPDAKILGLADSYAGLTLPPPPRVRLRPHEAVREIVRSRHEAFPPALVKALLSEISVFPPGTLVRLNTGEVGRVVVVNRNHPLRPRVEILADGKGQRSPAGKVTDLAEAPFLYITSAVAEGAR